MVRGLRAYLFEKFPTFFKRLHKRSKRADLLADPFPKQSNVLLPVWVEEVGHSIRAEGRDDPVLPNVAPKRLVVIERISCGIGGRQHLNAESVVQCTRTESGGLEDFADIVKDPLCSSAGEWIRNPEHYI